MTSRRRVTVEVAGEDPTMFRLAAGSGRKKTLFAKLKSTLDAPMPTARDATHGAKAWPYESGGDQRRS
jgi:hypothetical protein